MQSIQLINIKLKIYVIILFVLQVTGSLLSRIKNRYEYLPLPIKESYVEDTDDIAEEVSPTKSIITSVVTIPNGLDKNYSLKYSGLTQAIIMNSTKLNSEFGTAIQESKVEKRTISTEAVFYYYDQDKWPAVKLFVALTSPRLQQTPSATKRTKHRKRTWPPYFPPKLISKIQSELDEALLPWKLKTALPQNQSTNILDNTTEIVDIKSVNTQSYCYQCGLEESGIPRMPGCYHVFENDDYRTRKIQKRFKVKCFKSNNKKKINRKYYGPDYIGGCFKRFLDVGVEYNERGCRTKEPTRGKSYASKRLARLERTLKYTDNGCVFSPYASLTPFSRAISLYARYHVCVCNTKYCNQALRSLTLNFYYNYFLLTLYFLIYF